MAMVDVENENGDFGYKLEESEGRFIAVTITGYRGDLEDVIIPDNIGGIPVTVIGDSAFFGNKDIKSVMLPEGIVTIEDSAFWDCTNLKSIKLPQSLVNIMRYAFKECTSLCSINLPQNLATIEYDAFSECTSLTDIYLPKSIVNMEDNIFADCSNLKEITVDEQNPCFSSCDGVLFDKIQTTLILYPPAKAGDYTIPDSVNTIERSAFKQAKKLAGISFPKDLFFLADFTDCEQIRNFKVNENSKSYSSVDGVLFNRNYEGKMNELIFYPQGKKNTDYIVPDGITYIAFFAFRNCNHLENIILPESIETIGAHAFHGCRELTALTLPMSLEYIAEDAFRECPNLETITLSKNTKYGYKAFDGFKGKLIYRD